MIPISRLKFTFSHVVQPFQLNKISYTENNLQKLEIQKSKKLSESKIASNLFMKNVIRDYQQILRT